MNGKAGVTGMIVVILTAFGFLYPLERAHVAAARQLAGALVAGDAAYDERAAHPLGSDLVCQYTHGGRDAAAEPAGRCDRDVVTTNPVVIAHVVVAILPDPLDSHLDWGFDAALESIQRGFEHSGFVPDRYWLPWKPVPDSGAGDTDAAAALRASAPGVMLFRNSSTAPDALALVYLVGETPTRGIQARALRVALADYDTLLSRASAQLRIAPGVRDTVHIVGPILSGSARSLRNALSDAFHARGREVSIISGGATAPSNRVLLSGCGDSIAAGAPCPGARLHFAATVQPLDTLRAALERVLCDDFHIGRSRIAYLKESTTQYAATAFRGRGSACDADPHTGAPARPLEIPFPLNISRLRREYARLTPSGDSLGRNGSTSRTRLDWRDPASAAESPPPLSELTAPIIERTLTDIEQTLVLHRIQAVGIIATDVRDRLFLAEAVKERFRDVKVFFFGSHALYLRPEVNDELRGALVVSTYPLFLENQFWDLSHGGDRERLVFTSDLSEGTYNATLVQLGHAADATDYGFPLGDDTERTRADTTRRCGPPVWLTVVGAGSMMPLVALRGRASADARGDTGGYVYWRKCPPQARSPEEATAVANEGFFPILLAVVFIVLCLLGMRVAWRARREIRDAAIKAQHDMRPTVSDGPTAPDAREPATGERAVRQGAGRGSVRGAPGFWWASARTLATRMAGIERRRAVSDSVWQARSLALLIHHISWLGFGFVAAVCGAATLALILFRPRVHGVTPVIGHFWIADHLDAARLGLAAIVGIVVVAAIFLAGTLAADYLLWHDERSRATDHELHEARRWQHGGLLVIASLYLALTAAWIGQIIFLDPPRSAMYLLRTLQLNSGVTPAVPALLGSLVLIVWTVAHIRRVTALASTSAFEAACAIGAVDTEPIAPELYTTMPHAGMVMPSSIEAQRQTAVRLGTPLNFTRWVNAVRSSLLDIFPRLLPDRLAGKTTDRTPRPRSAGIAFAVALAVFWTWILVEIEDTNEVAILGPLLGVPGTSSSFDVLFWFLLIAACTLSAWTLYRLVTTWHSLRNCLRNIAVLPVGRGFDRLPDSVARGARFSPFTATHTTALQNELDLVAYQRWRFLRQRVPDAVLETPPVLRTRPGWANTNDLASPFKHALAKLCALVNEEPAFLDTSAEPHRRAVRDESRRSTIMALQELVALYVVDYVTWALRQTRDLAAYLLLSLTLTTALLSSYPFEPASFLKVAFFTLMAASVVEIGTVLVQVNRNATLSRIANTTPGEVTWDFRFVANLLLVAGVPLLTVLAAQFPEVRSFLFAWVTPIVKGLGKV